MKNKAILRMTFFMLAVILFSTCGKLPMEKAQDAYDATKVVPIIQNLTGATSVLQTFSYEYSVAGNVRAGSTIAWTVADCAIESLSEDTHTAMVKFATLPPVGTKAKIQAVETTVGGQVSPVKEVLVTVSPFCPVADISAFFGAYGGTDAKYDSQVVIAAKNSTSVTVTGLNYGWIVDYWGETVTSGGSITMNLDVNKGVISIADQYLFTTDYDGSPYDYWIKATTGLWSNCGAKPTITFSYQIYYKDPANGGTYPTSSTKFSAALVKN